MPTTVIKTIGAGQDYTTIAAWEAATRGNLVTADEVRVGQIATSANFNESITFAGCTTDATRYRKLTVADGHWHEGTYSTSKARMLGKAPTGGRHIIVETDDYTVIERLQFSHVGASPGVSDEAIRLNVEAHHTVISRCIFRGDRDPTTGDATSDTDAIYINHNTNGQTCTVHIDNCLFYDWGRTGIHPQFHSGSHDGGTVRINVDHCTFDNCGNTTSEPDASGIHARNATGTTTTAIHVYNCVGGVFTNVSAGAGKFLLETDSSGRGSWFGSHNADTDGSVAASPISLSTGAQSSKVRTDIFVDPDNDNYRPKTGGALENNGTNRIGSEPDPRQNFALDIAGVTRGTTGVEIGAYTIAATGVTGTLAAQETGSDTAAISGTISAITATLAGQESGADLAVFTGTVGSAISGTLAATETGSDVAAISGTLAAISAALAAQESGSDTAAITGTLAAITAALAGQEAGGDTASVSAILAAISASLAAQEIGSDTAAVAGTVGDVVFVALAAQESGSDQAAINATLAAITAALAAQESGGDVAVVIGNRVAAWSLVSPPGGSWSQSSQTETTWTPATPPQPWS